MPFLHTAWDMLCDLLFPHPLGIAQFSTITSTMLARTAVHPWVTREVQCLAPLPYTHAIVREAVHAAKFHNHSRAARLLGETLAPFLAEELAERRMLGTFTAPLLVPIPLHVARMRERGYNQVERIAHALLANIGDTQITLTPQALFRLSNTPHQTHQHDRATRLHNVQDAFKADLVCSVGKDIILLDDVITTGATLREAQKTLLSAGAREVLCMAVAH